MLASTTDCTTGLTTAYSYWPDGRTATVTRSWTDASGPHSVTDSRTQYDALGRPVTNTDANGETSTTTYDANGQVPCQIDGGLKCFGHPIGASGLRMAYEVYTQINGRAGARQLKDPVMGLTHNLGGIPNRNVCSVSILGRLNQ